jgi:predicted enzyme related to lactoylglutathione lyase
LSHPVIVGAARTVRHRVSRLPARRGFRTITAVYNPIRHITADAHDPHALAAFWARVSGFTLHPETEADDTEVLLQSSEPAAPGLLFIHVPDDKRAKNRVHLDIQPETGTRDAEVERLLGFGATVYEDHRRPDGSGWVTMLDPEGNEFCVERSAAERAAG